MFVQIFVNNHKYLQSQYLCKCLCCSDDLAAEHYRLAPAVLIESLWPTTELNHIFYWNYNRLKHSLGDRTLWVAARCSDDLAAAHYRLAHAVPMVGLWHTTEPNHIFYWNYNRLKHTLGGCAMFR